MSMNGQVTSEPVGGPQEIMPLGPGWGYRVKVMVRGDWIDLGYAEDMGEALAKLNRAKDGLGLT
jgi:hypothetical protein